MGAIAPPYLKLQLDYRRNGPSLLIAEGLRQSQSKSGEHRGFRKAGKTALNTGKGPTSTVMFWLVPQTKMPKLIKFNEEAALAFERLPGLILKNWSDS